MSVASWPGTGYGPVVEIGYRFEHTAEYLWDQALWGGEAPPIPAYAVVASTATEVGPAMGTANPLPSPAGLTVGDLLVAFVSLDGGQPFFASAGWTQLGSFTPGAHRLTVFARVATGTAADTLTLNGDTGSGNDYCAAVHRITGHTVTNPAADIPFGITGAATGGGNSPSLNAGSEQDWLWLAGMCTDRVGTGYSITAMPANYAQIVNMVSADYTAASALAVAQRSLHTQTEDPGPFTQTQSWYWAAATVAIPGGTPTEGGPVANPGRWGPWWQWRALECDVAEGSSIVRGTASPSQRPSSATASMKLVPRDNTLAPWYVDPVTGERPNRGNLPLRVGVTHLTSGVTSWLFTGWVDYITEVDSPDELTVTVVASDGFKHLALLNQGEVTPAQGAGEAAGQRIRRVLERAEWDRPHDLSPGTFALQGTTLARAALEEIYLVADTEAGVVWIDTSGAFRFGDRDWLRAKGERVDWRLGDGTEPDAICVSSIVTTADDMDIQNVIGVAREGGTASWLEDPDSIAKYGRHSWSRFDLPYADDDDTPTILNIQLADRTARDYHVTAVVLSPLVEAAAWDCALGVDLYDTAWITRRRGPDMLAEAASIIGVDHSFGPGEFVTVLSLGPRLRQTLARWDVDVWDTARWSAT